MTLNFYADSVLKIQYNHVFIMLNPTQDYILVESFDRKQSDNLHVVSYEKHCRGRIVRVGPGKLNKKGKIIPLDVKVGEEIIFGDGNFDFYPKVYFENKCYRIIQEADICGVIEDAIKN